MVFCNHPLRLKGLKVIDQLVSLLSNQPEEVRHNVHTHI